jgi:hypothetical protein
MKSTQGRSELVAIAFVKSSRARAIAAFAILVSVLAACAYTDPGIGQRDCATFWLVGRLALHGQSPYAGTALADIAVSEGYDISHGQLSVRTPPWSLWPMIPLGFFEGRWAWGLWIGWSVAALLVGVHWTWQMYGRREETKRLFTILAYCFPPVLACLAAGQFGIILFLGVAGFLRYHDEHPWVAGSMLVLPAIKPQLFTAFWVALLFWAVREKRWRLVGGSVLAFTAANMVALLIDPAVFQHYMQSAGTDSAPALFIPTLSTILRALVARSHYWLQFLPAGLGALWGAWYYVRNRRGWNWQENGPTMLVVSAAVTPHGWFTDEVFVLPAVLMTAMRVMERPKMPPLPLLALLAPLGLLLLMVFSKVPLGSGVYFWSPLLWLGWHAYGWRKPPFHTATAEGAAHRPASV